MLINLTMSYRYQQSDNITYKCNTVRLSVCVHVHARVWVCMCILQRLVAIIKIVFCNMSRHHTSWLYPGY